MRARRVDRLVRRASASAAGAGRFARRRANRAVSRLAKAVTRGDDLAGRAADAVPVLLARRSDAPPRLAEAIRRALRSLVDPAAQHRVCDEAINGDPEARAAAVDAGYLPAADHDRALFCFVTEQWERYTDLDFDGQLLAVAYAAADVEIQARLREVARRSGRADVLRMLLGGDRRARVRTLTPDEADYLLDVLLAGRRYDQVWTLLFELSFDWAMAAVLRLDRAGFTPGRPHDTLLYQRMVACAHGYDRNSLEQAQARLSWRGRPWLGPWLLPCGEARIHGSANGVSFAPDAPHLAIGTNAGQVGLWDLETEKLLWRRQVSATHPIGRVLHLGGGRVFAAERSYGGSKPCRLYAVHEHGKRLLGQHSETITALLGLPDGRVLTTGAKGMAALWTPDGEKAGPRLPLGPNSLAALSPDGTLLAVCRYGLVLIDRSSWRQIAHTPSIPGVISAVAFSPDGAEVLVGTHHGAIRVFAARPGSPGSAAGKPLARHNARVVGIVPAASGDLVMTADSTGLIRAHAWPERTVVGEARTGRRTVSLTMSASGGLVAAGEDDGTVSLGMWWGANLRSLLSQSLADAVPADLEPLDITAGSSHLQEVAGPLASVAVTLAAMLRYRFRHEIHVGDPAAGRTSSPHDIELG